MTGILCHPSLKRPQPKQPEGLSDEARAAIVRDSIGILTEGDCRKRVYETALEQIRNAKAQQLTGRT